MRKRAQDEPTSIRKWTLALGFTGFAAGFFGPMILNPDSNIGPIVGILFTGPGGVVAGFVLGVLFRLLDVPAAASRRILIGCCTVLGVGTLIYCLPDPAVDGRLIDAQVQECVAPTTLAEAALDVWRQSVARTTHYTPPADWEQQALRNVRHATGVVAVARISRQSLIHRHRKPWNRGRITLTPWTAAEETKHYYLRDRYECESYIAQGRMIYLPFTDDEELTDVEAPSWPPTDITGFLRLMELKPAPASMLAHLRK